MKKAVSECGCRSCELIEYRRDRIAECVKIVRRYCPSINDEWAAMDLLNALERIKQLTA